MAQFLKTHIRETIINAALHEFAAYGYLGARIAGIAGQAGVSTGNVYRYFKNKSELFDASISNSFVSELLEKFRRRVAAYPEGVEPDAIPQNSSFFKVSEELLSFSIKNRLQVLIVLDGAQGTKYEDFSHNLENELTQNILTAFHFEENTITREALLVLLQDIYKYYLLGLSAILRRYTDEKSIRSAVDVLSRYHLGGLTNIIK